jgi:hypothetical protein
VREHPDLPGACGSSASEPGSCPRPCRSSPSAAHRRGRRWSTRERPPSSCRRQLKQCLKLSVKVAPSPIGPFAIERAVRRTVRSSSRSCQSPCCWERNDPGSPTKPKVTGSNPVGRAEDLAQRLRSALARTIRMPGKGQSDEQSSRIRGQGFNGSGDLSSTKPNVTGSNPVGYSTSG